MYKVSLLQQRSATGDVIQNETEWSNIIQGFIFATNYTASSNLTGKINIILFIYEETKMEKGLFFYILRFNVDTQLCANTQLNLSSKLWLTCHIWTWFHTFNAWMKSPPNKEPIQKAVAGAVLARLMTHKTFLTNQQAVTWERKTTQTFRLH